MFKRWSSKTITKVDPEYGTAIRKDNGYDANSYTYYPVVICGAGAAGIAMGCRLKEVLGCDQFRIYDRQSGIGGTWWINRYPGVACDMTDWSSLCPKGPEIVEYLQTVCEKYEIVDKVTLNTDIKEARWLETEQVWEVTIRHLIFGYGDLSALDRARKIEEGGLHRDFTHEEKVRCKVLVSGVGGLVEPRAMPKHVKGFETFKGDTFHSARWDYNVDLKDKNIIVVGTGASAAQFVPELVEGYGAKSVTQLMRSPPWVVPFPTPPGGLEAWEKWTPWLFTNVPGLNKAARLLMFLALEGSWSLFGTEPHHNKERAIMEKHLLEYMRKTVPEKFHDILTPDYGVGCKRRIFDIKWFASLNNPAVEITTQPLISVGEETVTLGSGRTYPAQKDDQASFPEKEIPADVIILANGFDTTAWFHPLQIHGRDGKQLHEVFKERGGPQMYMGLVMDNFPNFFTLWGPNTITGHSSAILAIENGINLSLNFIGPILKGDMARAEIKRDAEMAWSEEMQNASRKLVWYTPGCKSWYVNDGWNSTVYPHTQINFTYRAMFPTWSDWNVTYTPKGLVKRRTKQLLSFVMLALFIFQIRSLRKAGGIRGLTSRLKNYVQILLLTIAGVSSKAASKI